MPKSKPAFGNDAPPPLPTLGELFGEEAAARIIKIAEEMEAATERGEDTPLARIIKRMDETGEFPTF